ncbi:class I SAM-dependent methyltransferase [Sporanaerobacter sp. PP17-6a]|uniref:class I SAM-dependent methyltransferase n=1 Tax=Sporanaerobacter sp. PP17-6a TaxID=1891289 RepID=UPI00089FA46F|nr:class I SAM-dependent methyltransferase [Sporanaerobacter sp. PP17-6a]SCL88672.1 putative methyltransferase [Sporanaerobacter sp. PP17-6a]
MLDSKGFDLWADGYDKSVNMSEESNEYPFAGYKDVLNYIYKQVKGKNSADILDIGFGTGILTSKLYNEGYNITGIDFSSNMIDIAKQKMPRAILINWDFKEGIPDEIKNRQFDYIISTYAIHHITDKEKINFINLLSPMLTETGKIILGDVSFENKSELEKCKRIYNKYWDDEEFYFIAEEILRVLQNQYLCKYTKLSYCAGVLTVMRKANEFY